jgi:GT2 family glycosyltransferase
MTAATAPTTAPPRSPSVLVVLIVRDAAAWLRDTLQALSSQSYPRIGIVAIDDASGDGSHELLVQALGAGRVVRNEETVGPARSIDQALQLPVAAGADFLLLLRDDVALDPEAVERLVDATRLPGVERVGLVGAKIVDWDHPRRLRDVGRSADRFGHPYTPLQVGEIDQGQFDRVLDVLTVDTAAALVARDVWQQLGLLDDRLGDDDADVDLGWRARVAGWRVLMTPLARARRRATPDLPPPTDRSRRYEEDRAALASVLKNYSWVSLLWILPLDAALSLVRLLFLLLSRRFEEAYDLVSAIGWNVVHLPRTLRLRRRVQRSRRVKDHALRRFHESAGLRIPRWFQTAERILEEQRDLEVDEASASARLRHRTASLLSAHPVLVASFLGAVVGLLATRHLIAPDPLLGGALPAFPSHPSGFSAELVSAYRTTALGGSLAASPALGALGGLSWLTLGSTVLAQKVVLAGALVVAAVLAYRALVRLTGRPGASVGAAAAYVASAVLLWAFSQGRIGLLAVLVVLPPIVERLEAAFGDEEPADGRWRFVAGLAVTIAVGVAFEPGVLLALGLLLIVEVLAGTSRVRGVVLTLASVAGAAILLFSFLPTIATGDGAALRSEIGTTDPWLLVRLALGPAPGGWWAALFLPVAALLGLALASSAHRRLALRATMAAVAGLAMSWLSVAGYLPGPFANAPVYAAVTAIAEAILVGVGIASVATGLEREAFGFRQIGTAALTLVLGAGLVLQSAAAVTGRWGVGGADQIPAAWALVDSTQEGSFRVLWLGADDGEPFPAPGGDPQGVAEAGGATTTFGITNRDGAPALDLGRPLVGGGRDALETALVELLAGTTTHVGALLAPFGVRYVVAWIDQLPAPARAALDRQADLDHVPAAELVIFRNAVLLSPAAVVEADGPTGRIVASGDPAVIQRFRPVPQVPLETVEGGWSGATGGGNLALVSTEFDGAWELEGSDAAPQRAFGWATDVDVAGSTTARVLYGAQLPRTIESWLLLVLWAAALWFTRKPVRR